MRLIRMRNLVATLRARCLRWIRSGFERVRSEARERCFPQRVRHLHGPHRIRAKTEEMIVVCLVRDGAAYVDPFLKHHREIGARHFVFLDNGSSDDTVEKLMGQPDVTLLRSRASYRDYKMIMKRYLLRRFGRECWVLCVDIDEHFDYPLRAEVSLTSFLSYLNRRGFTAVVTQMLDMFPQDSLGLRSREATTEFSRHCYYDLSALRSRPYMDRYGASNGYVDDSVCVYSGGVRGSAFGVEPFLTKHALVFPSGGAYKLSSHSIRSGRTADVTAVLLHYKYVGAFMSYAKRVVEEASFYKGSTEYHAYVDVITNNPNMSLFSEHSRELVNVDQLVDDNFIVISDSYIRYAASAR